MQTQLISNRPRTKNPSLRAKRKLHEDPQVDADRYYKIRLVEEFENLHIEKNPFKKRTPKRKVRRHKSEIFSLDSDSGHSSHPLLENYKASTSRNLPARTEGEKFIRSLQRNTVMDRLFDDYLKKFEASRQCQALLPYIKPRATIESLILKTVKGFKSHKPTNSNEDSENDSDDNKHTKFDHTNTIGCGGVASSQDDQMMMMGNWSTSGVGGSMDLD
mmetsp:Transcript_20982/g.23734  ORF Transcript_20982/g.23734 Transcript_20982/m.23734 type:complete len:217 (+) Transcript_20982:211-861(+)